MDYHYDVFVSYTHAFPFGTWVHEHFLPLFQGFLDNELNRRAELFVDKQSIHAGDAWPARLKHALAHSRCLVGVWCPSYFNSLWCRCECAVMHHRQQKLGCGTQERPTGLIVPVRVNDGENFPQFAKDMQQIDFIEFARVGSGFTKSERYVAFQDAVASFASDAARAIVDVPCWQEEWGQKEWIDDVIAGLLEPTTPIAKRPTLA